MQSAESTVGAWHFHVFIHLSSFLLLLSSYLWTRATTLQTATGFQPRPRLYHDVNAADLVAMALRGNQENWELLWIPEPTLLLLALLFFLVSHIAVIVKRQLADFCSVEPVSRSIDPESTGTMKTYLWTGGVKLGKHTWTVLDRVYADLLMVAVGSVDLMEVSRWLRSAPQSWQRQIQWGTVRFSRNMMRKLHMHWNFEHWFMWMDRPWTYFAKGKPESKNGFSL